MHALAFVATASLLLGCNADKVKLFETTVNVDDKAVPLAVHEGESPATIANEFAATHKLDQKGAQAVFYHLKQKAAQQGLIKRVLYYQPFIAEVGEPKEKKMYNLTVYEDSDPAQLAIEAGNQFGLPPNQQGQLKVAIESQMLQRVSLRIPIDLSANKIGKQLLLVRNGDDANTATLRFQSQLKDMGVDLSQTGLQGIAKEVLKQIEAKQKLEADAQAKAVAENAKLKEKEP